jgi:hypothetical protein
LSPATAVKADRRNIIRLIKPPTPQLREEFLINPRASNAETDETGFVTMPLGIFAKSLGSNLEIVQLHFRILTKQHLGEIVMYRYRRLERYQWPPVGITGIEGQCDGAGCDELSEKQG